MEKIREGMEKKHVLIVGAGPSIKKHRDKILSFIDNNKIITLGVNYMTSLCIPDYHLWIDKLQYCELGSCINKKSKLIFSWKEEYDKFIPKHWDGDYTIVRRFDKGTPGQKVKYKNGIIYGWFDRGGLLAIMLAHINKASKISIVGMDGHTYYSREDIESGKEGMHCYGKGHTDRHSWEECKNIDWDVKKKLKRLKEKGFKFSILTPTKYKDHYDPTILNINE